jgi:hypothetical protein
MNCRPYCFGIRLSGTKILSSDAARLFRWVRSDASVEIGARAERRSAVVVAAAQDLGTS